MAAPIGYSDVAVGKNREVQPAELALESGDWRLEIGD
jgi:hypothetical protein